VLNYDQFSDIMMLYSDFNKQVRRQAWERNMKNMVLTQQVEEISSSENSSSSSSDMNDKSLQPTSR
jgi:hypothetical protein